MLPLEEEERLALHLYAPPSGTGGGQLYSDAGDGYGAWRLDQFTVVGDKGEMVVDWQTEGDFALNYDSVEVCLHGAVAEQVCIDGEPRAMSGKQLAVGAFRQLCIKVGMVNSGGESA